MRRATATAAAMVLTAAGAAGAFAGVTGTSDVAAFTGNGRLTCGITAHGRLVHLRWPSPGYADHLDYLVQPDGAHKPNSGAMWAVESGGRVVWLTESASLTQTWLTNQAGVHTLRLQDTSLPHTYELTAFVPPEHDVVALHLHCTGMDAPPRIFWYANAAPCTRLIPHAPVGDWLFDPWNDFAAFVRDDGQGIVHFRPDDPGPHLWERVDRMVREQRSEGEWSTFPPGIYLAYGSRELVAAAQCGQEDSPSAAFAAVAEGTLRTQAAAIGACDSALALVPTVAAGEAASGPRSYSAVVYVAAAAHAEDAVAAVDRAKAIGFEALAAQTRAHWQAWLDQAVFPAGLPADIQDRCRQALMMIAVSTDRDSGAIVRSPRTQPPHALNWSRHAVWINLALDVCGYHDLAGRNLAFLLKTVRNQGEGGRPGSMPAAVYANGVAAFPDYIHDVDNVGWLLWSVWQHAQMLPLDRRRPFLEEAWEPLAHAAEFLTLWADARDGAPLHSFNWQAGHDTQDHRTALVAFLGLESAVRVAVEVEREPAVSWLRRRNELDVLIQLRYLHQKEHGDPADDAVFWLTEQLRRPPGQPEMPGAQSLGRRILEPQDPRWLDLAQRALSDPAPGPRALRDAAWLGSGIAQFDLEPSALRRVPLPFVDATDAADFILAAVASAGTARTVPPFAGIP
jgi:hypothetical protein